MEFLSFIFLALAVFIAWKKPEKENLAFGAFAVGTAICFIMFLSPAGRRCCRTLRIRRHE